MRRRLRSRPPTAIAVIAMITALGVRVSLTTRLSLTNRRARLAIVGGGGQWHSFWRSRRRLFLSLS